MGSVCEPYACSILLPSESAVIHSPSQKYQSLNEVYTPVKCLLETYNLLDFIHILSDTNCVY